MLLAADVIVVDQRRVLFIVVVVMQRRQRRSRLDPGWLECLGAGVHGWLVVLLGR
jgi:hypothetical protein